jgi:hypothetical protein
MQPVHQFAEHLHLLRELGILPEVILVMVLQDQRHPAPLRLRQAGLDVLDHDLQALRPLSVAAAAAPTARGNNVRPELSRHPDPVFLPLDLALTAQRPDPSCEKSGEQHSMGMVIPARLNGSAQSPAQRLQVRPARAKPL